MRLAISVPQSCRALIGPVVSTSIARDYAADDEANNGSPCVVVRLPRRIRRGWVQKGAASSYITRWALRFSALNPGIRGNAHGARETF